MFFGRLKRHSAKTSLISLKQVFLNTGLFCKESLLTTPDLQDSLPIGIFESVLTGVAFNSNHFFVLSQDFSTSALLPFGAR